MCGIAGVFGYAGDGAVNVAQVEKMCEAMRHRGPDGVGFLARPGLVLGHVRLSIIDIEGGAQPISNEDNSVSVVFNGEIYNYWELRRELEGVGHIFRTRSDTEVPRSPLRGLRTKPRPTSQWRFCVRHLG